MLGDHPGAQECDLVVKGNVAGERARLALRRRTAPLPERPRRRADARPTPRCARSPRRAGQELTYTCVPPGLGRAHRRSTATTTRFFDRDELDFGSDPEDETSLPVPEPAQALLLAIGAAALVLAAPQVKGGFQKGSDPL